MFFGGGGGFLFLLSYLPLLITKSFLIVISLFLSRKPTHEVTKRIVYFIHSCKVLKDYQKENYLSVTTSAKRILNVVFLVPLFGYSKQTPLIILR